MKKLLSIILVLSFASAFGLQLQTWYYGTWESTVQYNTKPIYGSTTSKTTPIVKDASGTYVANGASTPIKGTRPETNTAAWDSI